MSEASDSTEVLRLFKKFTALVGIWHWFEIDTPIRISHLTLSMLGELWYPETSKYLYQYRYILLLQTNLFAMDRVFKKLKHNSVIIGCWNIHRSVHLLFRLMHTSVDISARNKRMRGGLEGCSKCSIPSMGNLLTLNQVEKSWRMIPSCQSKWRNTFILCRKAEEPMLIHTMLFGLYICLLRF